MTRSRHYLASAKALLGLAPLLCSTAPRSVLAHDEGYYILQARWIQQSNQWLAPLWWGQPLYDRTIGVQWLIATSERLLGSNLWAAHFPSLVSAGAALWFTAQLGSLLLGPGQGWLSALLLGLTPLWLNYAHQASQDMPLLALELLGLLAILKAKPGGPRVWTLLAGLWFGPAVLVKGFMAVVPAVALTPLVLKHRQALTRDYRFWLGLALGLLPVSLWIVLSLERFGPDVVGGLVDKLLYLSASETYSAGPLYYLWNIPANAAPWSLAALAGLIWGWRRWRGEQRLALVMTPLLLIGLLSAFRTKTPYYGLQLTPFLALWASAALHAFTASGMARPRWLALSIGVLGALLTATALTLFWPATGVTLDVSPLPRWVVPTTALVLGLSWLALPSRSNRPESLTALLMGPWLAMVLLVQGGLFTDRSPLARVAVKTPAIQAVLQQGQVAVIAPEPLSGEAHSQLILMALATPQLGHRLSNLEQLPVGQWAWIQREQAASAHSAAFTVMPPNDDLLPWTLVQRRSNTPKA